MLKYLTFAFLIFCFGCATQSPFMNQYSQLDSMYKSKEITASEYLQAKQNLRSQELAHQQQYNTEMMIFAQQLQEQQRINNETKLNNLYTKYPGLATQNQRLQTNCYQIGNMITCN